MAEFAEVMRQAHRMCDVYDDCNDCPLSSSNVQCAMAWNYYTDAVLKEFEQTVRQWAKEHPEPKYPTWREWKNENFPDAPVGLTPCSFMSRERQGKIMGEEECVFLSCADCVNTPIPADIAKKLGIRPKEV